MENMQKTADKDFDFADDRAVFDIFGNFHDGFDQCSGDTDVHGFGNRWSCCGKPVFWENVTTKKSRTTIKQLAWVTIAMASGFEGIVLYLPSGFFGFVLKTLSRIVMENAMTYFWDFWCCFA